MVWRETPRVCDVAEIWVRRRKHELAEFIEGEGHILISVVLPDDIFYIVNSSAQVVFVHEIEQLVTSDRIATVDIN